MIQIEGCVWKFGDHVSTDLIIPTSTLMRSESERSLGERPFAVLKPEFPDKVQVGDFIVAGQYFACGSIRPLAPLLDLGIGGIIAESFGPAFFRQCVYEGLPAIAVARVLDQLDEGDRVQVEIRRDGNRIINLTTGGQVEVPPFPDIIRTAFESGGLRKQIGTAVAG